MPQEQGYNSSQEELEALKQRVAELESSKTGGQRLEKTDMVKEAIREHAERPAEQVLPVERRLSPHQIGQQVKIVSALRPQPQPQPRPAAAPQGEIIMDEHKPDIERLLQIVEQEGLWNALAIVRKIGNPHLEDDFHDALIQYLQSQQ